MKKLMIVCVICLQLMGVVACAETKSWSGTYIYEADYGKNYPGTPMIVSYTLIIDPTSCLLEISGYQAAQEITCEVLQTKSGIEVHFVAFSATSMQNFKDLYRQGDLLFSLEEKQTGLLTYWKIMNPEAAIAEDQIYFKKYE
ncbi:DUF5991 domain-containing protein [Cellvibrio sp. PSBB023]|uniref:DUF5991 domain-containing protein n=1 Tax=Cellvibrio sp. PSBB023 TaxID=1945512 RepID=UPI00098E9A0B|nr:DUF5991 domain-containing protein [Cellvibrio sp. PSBB023]AQT61247.1 hypothetical protein B0D95_14895 [Cellvibrio sp. PSBB023]